MLCLQETWLSDQELPYLANVHPDFYGRGVSAMDSSAGMLVGRPYGGVAILWRKSLGTKCTVTMYDDSRLISIDIFLDKNRKFSVMNAYLPHENGGNADDYMHYLAKVLAFMEHNPYSCVCGDFNADTLNASKFGMKLQKWIQQEGLMHTSQLLLHSEDFSFLSEAHGTCHRLDHMISNHSFHNIVTSVSINYNFISSDHFPLFVQCKLDSINLIQPSFQTRSTLQEMFIPWDKLSKDQLQKYTADSKQELEKIKYDHSLILCDDINCTSHAHRAGIDTLYHQIVDALITAAYPLSQPSFTRAHHHIPGWNTVVADVHAKAREAFILWNANSKPKQGPIWELMRTSRAEFKYALRQCRQQESIHKTNALANSLLKKDTKQFWKHVKRTQKVTSTTRAESVGGSTGVQEVANMWRQHYSDLLNTPQPKLPTNNSNNSQQQPSSFDRFSVGDVNTAMQKLKTGKSSGHDGLKAEHFKFAHRCSYVLLSLLFNCMLVHGHVPQEFTSTVIIPLVKDKKGDISDVDNYRPIALTTVMSKVFENIILERYIGQLCTSDNQFGFKQKHSTEQCIFSLKQVIDFYTVNSSPVYLCFMDLSKAFDMVHHEKLFTLLQKRGVHFIVVRLLRKWYATQLFFVKWGCAVSKPFSTSNGTRQGSILSPYLFNVYIDELSERLKSTGVGCYINNVCFNHLFYADDSVLVAPSPRALQLLIDVSFKFSKQNYLKYNIKKTKSICICPESRKGVICPQFYLDNLYIKHVLSHSYLGVFINSEMCDDDSVDAVIKSTYQRGNMIKRNFFNCTEDVKIRLFQTYCSNFYCCALWKNDPELLERVKICHNNVLRYFIHTKFKDSISGIFVNRNLPNFSILRRKAIHSLYRRVISSQNSLILTIVRSTFFTYSKFLQSWKACFN